MPSDNCHSCVSAARKDIRDRCPSRVNATIWYDECMLRYSDKNFLGTVEISPRFLMGDSGNQTSPDDRNMDGPALLSQLAREAAGSEMMFKANKFDERGTRYGLVQCTRDLNSSECGTCLTALLEEIRQCNFKERVGWRILGPSCNIRYEQYPFYQQQASQSQGDSNATSFTYFNVVCIPKLIHFFLLYALCWDLNIVSHQLEVYFFFYYISIGVEPFKIILRLGVNNIIYH